VNSVSAAPRHPHFPEGDCPYTQLFIYHVDGNLPGAAALDADRHFIGDWREDGQSFLFFGRPADGTVGRLLRAQPQLTLLDKYHMEYSQWQGTFTEPLRVGRLSIVPAWQPSGDTPDEVPIAVDPGVVFGSGTHATTRDCLTALQMVCGQAAIDTAADYGTGTGVLALAAARLGCRRVWALDFNLLAVQTAAANVRRNSLGDRILALQGRAQDWAHWPVDLAMANLPFDVLREIVRMPEFNAKPWLILYGLLRSQARDIAYVLVRQGLRLAGRWSSDGIWHTLCARAGAAGPYHHW
jgi:ribosomal protein L11 methyltransferase